MNIALCFLGSTHDDIDYGFLKSIKYYDVYVSLSNENEVANKNNITYINISSSIIKKEKYTNCTYVKNSNKGKINELEKALYYFTFIKKYPYIWFITKDVLIFDENQLIRMDELHKNIDYITHKVIESNKLKHVNWNMWPDVTRDGHYNFKAPFYHSLNNICRLSSAMLEEIKKYAIENKTLCYKDALFASLVSKNENLTYYDENTIKFLKMVDDNILSNTTKIYCNVNNIEKQIYYREKYLNSLKDSDDESDYESDYEGDNECDNNEKHVHINNYVEEKNIQTFDIDTNKEDTNKNKKSIYISCGLFLSFILAFQWLCNFSKNKNYDENN